MQKIVGAILGVHQVSPTDRLAEDLEAESIDVVNIIADIEDRLGVTLDDQALASIRTVADLQAVVRAARQ